MDTNIGERIKTLRIERKMTLADLSEKTNLSISYLSQVERDKAIPSLASIIEIGNALDTNPRYFFEVHDEHAFVIQTSLNQINSNISQNVEIFPLSPVDEPSRLRVWLYNLEPGKQISGPHEEDSEKICYVLKGKLTLDINGEVNTLNDGDSIAFDNAHSFKCAKEEEIPCSFIYACAKLRIGR